MVEHSRVIVTGGAGALGRAVVAWFEQEGARVAVVDISDDVIRQAFPRPLQKNLYVTCDLTDAESCTRAVEEIIDGFGEIDVLCNVAGDFTWAKPVHETTVETWNFLMDVNARSVFNMARAVVPSMQRTGRGKIVNVAARAGQAGMALAGAYTASKAAVLV
ncbi:MAG: SDR family NAD(P)-dependent oxidoreductase [Gammaproteobacteria bacterium]|nr:SDR family NAD(P)-dependent oxidoreductase [Gammaproteobacteria bacterium]